MGTPQILIYSISFIFLTFITRMLPLLRQPHRGSDAYYFLICRKIFKKDWKIPIKLPDIYTCEERIQSYPPGFTIFLALLPQRFIDRYYWCISPVMDALVCGSVVAAAALMFQSLAVACISGYIYLSSLSSLQETQSMTSRQLGALIFGITIISSILAYQYLNYGLIFLSLLSGVLLLFTHKLSTQALIICFILISLFTLDPFYLLFPLAMIVIATLISRGHYLTILRSHFDVIIFWAKNWPGLGAHQVKNSPIYGTPIDATRPSDTWQGGNRSFLFTFLVQNLYLMLCIIGAVCLSFISSMIHEQQYLLYWTLSIALVGILSYVVPIFRGIGFGLQYGKLALIPGALYGGSLWLEPTLRPMIITMLALFLYVGAKHYFLIMRQQTTVKGWDLDLLQPLFQHFKKLSHPHLMCLPNHMCDLIAYHCGIRVHWGSHGYPFSQVAHIIPVVSKSLPTVHKEFGVTHLLLDLNYATSEELKINQPPIWASSNLALFELGKE